MISCPKCNSKDILHEVKEGRGLPPKNWVSPTFINRKISWKGSTKGFQLMNKHLKKDYKKH
jgi:hypothetical protein